MKGTRVRPCTVDLHARPAPEVRRLPAGTTSLSNMEVSETQAPITGPSISLYVPAEKGTQIGRTDFLFTLLMTLTFTGSRPSVFIQDSMAFTWVYALSLVVTGAPRIHVAVADRWLKRLGFPQLQRIRAAARHNARGRPTPLGLCPARIHILTVNHRISRGLK